MPARCDRALSSIKTNASPIAPTNGTIIGSITMSLPKHKLILHQKGTMESLNCQCIVALVPSIEMFDHHRYRNEITTHQKKDSVSNSQLKLRSCNVLRTIWLEIALPIACLKKLFVLEELNVLFAAQSEQLNGLEYELWVRSFPPSCLYVRDPAATTLWAKFFLVSSWVNPSFTQRTNCPVALLI